MPETKFSLGDYVDVKERIRLFYERFPDGRLVTESASMSADPDGLTRVWCHARAYRTPDDPLPGDGWSYLAVPGSTPYTRGSEIENAETSAWGRAIGCLGLGIAGAIASRDEVQAKQTAKAEADEENAYPVGEWSTFGIAEAGSNAPADGLLRETPDGGVFGFVILAPDKKRFQVVAEGDLALPVSLVWESLKGQTVHVSGPTVMVPWTKKVNGNVRNMPPYRRIHANRIESGEIVIPAPVLIEAASLPSAVEEQALDALSEELHDAASYLGEEEEAELDAITEQLSLS